MIVSECSDRRGISLCLRGWTGAATAPDGLPLGRVKTHCGGTLPGTPGVVPYMNEVHVSRLAWSTSRPPPTPRARLPAAARRPVGGGEQRSTRPGTRASPAFGCSATWTCASSSPTTVAGRYPGVSAASTRSPPWAAGNPPPARPKAPAVHSHGCAGVPSGSNPCGHRSCRNCQSPPKSATHR